MTDTPPEIERMMREKIMARTGAERMIMGAEMFEASKVMICASFPPGLSESERKRRLFARLYGNEALAHRIWHEQKLLQKTETRLVLGAMQLEDHLGDMVRKGREAKGITAAEAAKAASLDEASYMALETSGKPG